MARTPSEILNETPMGKFQIFAVFLCVCLNALDGFDVLAISFASPGIAEEWGINRAQLGFVLSMELIGMAIGSAFLGNVADRIGRRPMILGCLIVMTVGMFFVTLSQGIADLSVYRFATGLGIGGMLASINAMAAEYSNTKNRSLSVALMAAGYPVGAVIGGIIASRLLQIYDWRSVFMLGTAMSAIFIPLVWFFMPESIEYLANKQSKGALEKINHTLKRMGHQTVTELPKKVEEAVSGSLSKLFSPAMRYITIGLTFAYFLHIVTFYYIIKWIPKIVVDMGNAASVAGEVLVWTNIGGMTGAILLSFMTRRINVKWLTVVTLAGAFLMVTYFGQGHDDIGALKWVCLVAGLFTNAAIVGLYALFAIYFPVKIRASGTGFVIGVGRGGAASAPIIAGFMFEAGLSLATVSLILASGSVIAAGIIAFMRKAEEATV